MLLALAMLAALAVDRLFGEPPSWAHPVVGIGQFLNLFGAQLKRLPAAPAFIGGALVWCLGALLIGALAALIETRLIIEMQPWASPGRLLACSLLIGLFLKPLLSWRMLRLEVAAVDVALAQSLDAGRTQLARLVSRDTSALDAAAVREAAIETLAENLNDSVVAPLFWFAIAGLPGAAIYRFANTADAMYGYRGDWEWAGKWAARADDLLSWFPARITGLLLLGLRPALLARLTQEAVKTPSPNSGWPMAAMALRLDLRLAKPGVYSLNDGGAAPTSAHMKAAEKLASQTLWISAAVLALAAWGLRA